MFLAGLGGYRQISSSQGASVLVGGSDMTSVPSTRVIELLQEKFKVLRGHQMEG